MGCNAHNHPPDCQCGWGGEHHDPTQPDYDSDYWSHEASHTTPNARCPVCDARVFFYRSPEGGAVYFDELGPPWPKHPCTDRESPGHPAGQGASKAGWWPFLVEFSGELLDGEGYFLSDVQNRLLLVKGHRGARRAPVWITSVKGQRGRYRLSTLKTHKGQTTEVVYDAYTLQALADPEIAKRFRETIDVLEDYRWAGRLEP